MSTEGFTFTGKGTLDRIDTFVSKAGKEIITLVFRVDGKYPHLVPCKVFGRLVEQAKALTIGTVCEVSGELGGRDWNGKVYGDNTARNIEAVGKIPEAQGSLPTEETSDLGSIPF